MKTIAKILIAAISLLFSLEVIAASDRVNSVATTSEIHYLVKINSSQIHSGASTLALFVMITDEQGRVVAPVQVVRPGLSTYTFSEAGPFVGTRIASMIFNPIGPSYQPFYCAPDAKTGKFVNGGSYLFNLYPTTNPPKTE